MNQIQIRFQSGAENCSWVEKVADGLLAFPKAMWGVKNISIIDGTLRTDYSFRNFFSDRTSVYNTVHDQPGALIALTCWTAFLIGSVAAAPLLGIGLIFKEIALRNPTAHEYNSKMGKVANFLLEAESIRGELGQIESE